MSSKEKPKWTSVLAITCLSISMSSFNYGYNLSFLNAPSSIFLNCTSATNSQAKSCVPISATDWSIIISIFNLGGLVGTLIGSTLCGRLGCKKTLLANNIFYLSGFILMALGNNSVTFIVARIFLGIGGGISVVACPSYLGDLSSANMRGIVSSIHAMALVFGIFIAQVLGIVWSEPFLWRLLFGFGVIPLVFQLISLPFCPETPKYYISRGESQKARDVFVRLGGVAPQNRSPIEGQKVDDSIELKGIAINESPSNPKDDQTREQGKNEKVSNDPDRKPMTIPMILTTPKAYRSLIVASTLHFLLQFSGINGLFFFSTMIFQNTGNSNIATVVSMGLGLVNLVFSILASSVIDRIGRRPPLLFGLAGLTICGAFLVISLTQLWNMASIVFIYLYISFFSVSLGCVPWIIISEIFPSNAVPAAASIIISVNWLSSFIVTISFETLITNLGGLFYVPFTVIMALGFVFVYFFVPEVKGKEKDYLNTTKQ